MTTRYEVVSLNHEETERLLRAYDDLLALCSCRVPSVNAAARAALAHVAQALNGEGIAYELYSAHLPPVPDF
jgi:hypothetical protein